MNIKHAVAISINSELFVRIWESEFIDLEGCQTYKEVKVRETHKERFRTILNYLVNGNEKHNNLSERVEKALEQGITISPELIALIEHEVVDIDDIFENGKDANVYPQLFAFIKEAKEETNEAIEFAEWTHSNGWRFDYKLKQWINHYGQIMKETTKELYEIFKRK